MLAMADQYGRVWASIPGLANIARVSIEACESALLELQSPDKYSRTTEHDGRRIEPIDGGWRLLNHAKYREIRDEESIKESKRRYINKRRAAERGSTVDQSVENVEQCRTGVERCRPNTEADTDTDTEKKKNTTRINALDIPDALFSDFMSVRKAKRSGPLTKTAAKAIQREADKAGLSLVEAVTICCEKSWTTFDSSWNWKQSASLKNKPTETFAERDERNAKEKWQRMTGQVHPDLAGGLPQHLNIIDSETVARIAL